MGRRVKTPTTVVFDAQDRQEFLASFKNRKKRLRKKTLVKQKEQERQAKRDKRKKKRERVGKMVQELREEALNKDNSKQVSEEITYHQMENFFPNERAKVICEKLPNSGLPGLDTERFLVPAEFTVGNLTTVIRNRTKIGHETSLFLFVGNSILPSHYPIATVYQEKKDQDGFLYVIYSGENSFGDRSSVKNYDNEASIDQPNK